MNYDRTKQSFALSVTAQVPQIDYLARYGGQVISQGGSNAFDFQPDDPRIPSMSGIPVKLPFPGFQLTLDESQAPRAEIGWDGGDPSKPEILLWENPGLAGLVVTSDVKQSFVAPAINLGGDPAVEPLILGTLFTTALSVLLGIISAAFTTIGLAFTAGVAAWALAGSLLPVLAPAAAIVAAPYAAAAAACTTAVSQIATFISNIPTYLSNISKTS